MDQTLNFVFAVVGFIVSCILIGKFVLTPLYQKFPGLRYLASAFAGITMILLILRGGR